VTGQLRIVVTGLIAQHPRLGGVAWDYLQYPVGLAGLGHDVYYLEDSGEWPYLNDPGPAGDWVAHDCTANLEHLEGVLSRFGLGDRWAYRYPVEPGARWFGLADSRRAEVLRTADLLINISGTLEHPERYRDAAVLAYVDSDPVFTQARIHLDPVFKARVDAHDLHFTFGERLSFGVAATGHSWLPTRQPILLDQWQTDDGAAREVFTTVMSWTSYEPLSFEGSVFAQKDVELLRFLDLPKRLESGLLEVALPPIHHEDWQSPPARRIDLEGRGNLASSTLSPQELLRAHGWGVTDATSVCATLDGYRTYLQDSYGEWSVAKNGYVQGQTGWFSGRSACYLAAGRPTIVQDTGFGDVLPVGEGLLSFSDEDGAVACIESVRADYGAHAAAARRLARDHFAAETVLSALIDQALGPSSLPSGTGGQVPPKGSAR